MLAEKEREHQEQIQLLGMKHEAALKATEEAIQEAKKAVESRKNAQTEIDTKLVNELRLKLAEAEQLLKKKDAEIS